MLLLLSAGLHSWKIGSAPPGFYIDEASVSYNAWSIAETGADENGNRFPLFFRFETQYQDPVLIYALAPFVRVFEPHEWVCRLPSALFHVLASVVFAFLVWEHGRNRWLALVAGFVLSIIPWLVPVSRTASGAYTIMIFGMTVGWLLSVRAFERASVRSAVMAAMGWALASYAYHAGRPMTWLLLACLALSFHRAIKAQPKIGVALFGGYLVLLAPLIVAVIRSPGILTARFEATGILQSQPSLGEALAQFGSRYLDYFGPRFLLFSGDTNLRHHTGHGGELYWFLAPLILAGLYAAVSKFDAASRFAILGWLAYPAAAALTQDRMHSMRCSNGVVFWLFLAAMGAWFLWEKRGRWRVLLLAAGCFGAVEISVYLKDYFGPYQLRCRDAFNAAFTEALADSFRQLRSDETLYISVTAFAPLNRTVNPEFRPYYYEDILFFGRIHPRQFQRVGIPKEKVRPFGEDARAPGLLLRSNVHWVRHAEFELSREALPPDAELLQTIPLSGGAQYEIYRLK